MAKWGSGRATPLVGHREAARGITEGGRSISEWISSPIPSEIAAMLTDPCGVTYYTNRMREAQEYQYLAGPIDCGPYRRSRSGRIASEQL